MDNLLVGTLSLPQFPVENSLPSVMSSASSPLCKTFWDHGDHRSENRDQLITISTESVIIFPRNPDHDHPGIAITSARNRRSPSPGIPSFRAGPIVTEIRGLAGGMGLNRRLRGGRAIHDLFSQF